MVGLVSEGVATVVRYSIIQYTCYARESVHFVRNAIHLWIWSGPSISTNFHVTI
jgi:hypothetical protein